MKKAGEELKRIREEKGYSLPEVSQATKISTAVLKCLEEGRVDNIDPIYLKGFVKIYCRFLGLGWEDFLKEYPIPSAASRSHKQAHTAQEPKEPPVKAYAQKAFSFNAVMLKNKRIILVFLSAAAALLFVILALRGCAPILRKLASGQGQAQKAAVIQPKKASKTATARPLAPKTQAVRQPQQSSLHPLPAAAAKEQRPKEITLVIRAQENSFLTVRVDGKPVYQRMLYKGKAESWVAKEKIELSVGNAGGITLELNGKIISSLGRKGQVIKNILITSEGLKTL